MQEFAEKHSPGLWETLLKALTGDCDVLTSQQPDLQKRRKVALLHILAYFREIKKIIFQQNPPKKVLVLIKNIQYNIANSHTNNTKITSNGMLIWSIMIMIISIIAIILK